MKKSDIAGRVAERAGQSRSAAGNAVDSVFESVREALANGEEVRIAGFGPFTTKSRSARIGRHPRTGESLEVQASTAPEIKQGKALKDAVNEGNGLRNGAGQGSGTSEARDVRDVEFGRFLSDDGDLGCLVSIAGETKYA